jgi:cyclopropane-fatty-acyl-phospholipid synthase
MTLTALEEELCRSPIVVRSTDALRRIATAPGEIGFARAYVAGDLDIEGDIYEALEVLERPGALSLFARGFLPALRTLGAAALRPLPPPPEEARVRGRRHSKERDAVAIAHHYDISNRFYRLVLGPSMTYSCALFAGRRRSRAHRKRSTTSSRRSSRCARECVFSMSAVAGEACLSRRLSATALSASAPRTPAARPNSPANECGRPAFRAGSKSASLITATTPTDPMTPISSIGMFEHVGLSQLATYFSGLSALLQPGGRLLNHGISCSPGRRRLLPRRTFMNRYVFPEGELHEAGRVVSQIQAAGLEVRHVESLRGHYALTLRRWVDNLEGSWDEAVAEVGIPRARIWRLYMAGCALGFEAGRLNVHQVLAVRPNRGRSGMPLQPGAWC